jgi:hypothetical protein
MKFLQVYEISMGKDLSKLGISKIKPKKVSSKASIDISSKIVEVKNKSILFRKQHYP